MLKIIQAELEHLEVLTPLFNAYRIFYKQPTDLVAAKTFLKQRVKNKESIIFIAFKDATAVGFTQLYISFSSVSLKPFYILNDLYVLPDFRGMDIGKQLLQQAKEQCVQMNFKGLALETALDNPAQKLYEKLDWQTDDSTLHYFWAAPKTE